MEQAVEQHRLESKTIEVGMNQVLHENERLLEQVINTDIVNVVVNSSVDNSFVNVHECEKCLKLETELLSKKDFIEKETYDKLLKSFITLEKHFISLEVDTQLNQEIFQRDNSGSNQNAPNFDQYFELNELRNHSKVNANSKLICVKCNGCMLYDNHEFCVLNFVNDVHAKSKSIKKISKRKVWKPTGKYLDFGCSKHMTGDRSQLTNFVIKFLGTIKFKNNHMAKIMGYGDYQIRNVTISKVYYVEGFGHNLFSVGQFCDLNLEVAFRPHTYFIRNLEGDDLLTGSRGNNLYTLSIRDMMTFSSICITPPFSRQRSGTYMGVIS
ncbi:hypothetical protein Tco_0140699 [Tanacetum coccineum]